AGAGEEIGRVRGEIDLALPVERRRRKLRLDAEARDADEGDEIAAVAGLGELGDPPGAADLVKPGMGRGSPAVRIGLDHPDHAIAAQGVVDHGEIAGLEDVQRHLPARQKERAREWEY